MTSKAKLAAFERDLRRVVRADHPAGCQCRPCVGIGLRVRLMSAEEPTCKCRLCVPCGCRELVANGAV